MQHNVTFRDLDAEKRAVAVCQRILQEGDKGFIHQRRCRYVDVEPALALGGVAAVQPVEQPPQDPTIHLLGKPEARRQGQQCFQLYVRAAYDKANTRSAGR